MLNDEQIKERILLFKESNGFTWHDLENMTGFQGIFLYCTTKGRSALHSKLVQTFEALNL